MSGSRASRSSRQAPIDNESPYGDDDARGTAQEIVAIIHSGAGSARVGTETRPVAAASALYAPSGIDYAVHEDQGETVTLYIWQSAAVRRRSSHIDTANWYLSTVAGVHIGKKVDKERGG